MAKTLSFFFLPLCSRADNLSDKLITRYRDALYHRFSFITPKLPSCLPANEEKKNPLPTYTVPKAVFPDGS